MYLYSPSHSAADFATMSNFVLPGHGINVLRHGIFWCFTRRHDVMLVELSFSDALLSVSFFTASMANYFNLIWIVCTKFDLSFFDIICLFFVYLTTVVVNETVLSLTYISGSYNFDHHCTYIMQKKFIRYTYRRFRYRLRRLLSLARKIVGVIALRIASDVQQRSTISGG